MNRVRLATRADIPELSRLIERSVRELHHSDYSLSQIEASLKTVFGVDTTLIDDETYFVVERDGELVGCGGWSKRERLFGGDAWEHRESALLDPAADAAKIRAFFVRPDCARRGLGTLLLEACEDAAKEAGFQRFELGATLPGVRLYEKRGYEAVERVEVAVGDGETVPVIRMVKS